MMPLILVSLGPVAAGLVWAAQWRSVERTARGQEAEQAAERARRAAARAVRIGRPAQRPRAGRTDPRGYLRRLREREARVDALAAAHERALSAGRYGGR